MKIIHYLVDEFMPMWILDRWYDFKDWRARKNAERNSREIDMFIGLLWGDRNQKGE